MTRPCLPRPLLPSLLLSLLWCSGAGAVTKTVTTLHDHDDGVCDSGDCTLREAINAGNATPGTDTILFAAGLGGTIQLSAALPDLSNTTLQGPGFSVLTVRRNTGGDYSVFVVSSGSTATISGLTISNGHPSGIGSGVFSDGGGIANHGTLTVQKCLLHGNNADDFGGAIFNDAGTLTVIDSALIDNNGRVGGAIYSYSSPTTTATLTVNNSALNGNLAFGGTGGAIHNDAGTATVQNCTFNSNSANSGGGISTRGTLTVQNSTFDSNIAVYGGGGIDCISGPAKVINSTLHGNSADTGGGMSNADTLTVQNCTLSANSAPNGGGLFTFNGSSAGGVITLRNTILEQGASGASLANSTEFPGTITSQGHNLSSDDGSGFLTGPGDLINTDPLLGPLQNNGGPTPTHALLAGSPAIDAGDDAVLGPPLNLTTDQRGSPRKLGAHVDIGAFEYDLTQSGATLVVNTTAERDDGICGVNDCTLLEALNAANADPDDSIINFKAGLGGTILNTLVPGGLSLTNPVTINGPGARVLTVSGNHASRLFNVAAGGSATISGLTIANASGVGSGGAIFSVGTLTLLDCALLNNYGGSGGAVASQGTLTVTNCTFAGNQSTGHGGAIRNASGAGIATAILTNSTFSGNVAVSSGAITSSGTAALPATVTLRSCTISGNTATDTAGGYGGGINNFGVSTVDIGNTIVASNSAANGPDVAGTFVSQGYNLIGNSDGGSGFIATGDQTGDANGLLDPKLDTLANNGGPTDTMALLFGSPAIDQGNALGLTTDQRGQARPFDQPSIPDSSDGSDIGAYERQAPTLLISDVTVTEGNAGTVNALFTVMLRDGPNASVSVHYATQDGTATAGSDYTAVPDTVLTFTAGQTNKTVTVPVLGDTLDEANETFKVNLTSASGASTVDGLGVGTIKDDDATPRFFIDDVTVTEGNSGTVNAVFNLTLSAASGRSVTVTYKTADGTAIAPADYVAHPSTTLTFTPGQTAKTITVQVKGDALDEANETFKVVLQAATNGAIVDNKGACIITDDDPLPVLSISDAPAKAEGNAGTGHNALFVVTLTGATGRTVKVNYATANGTATAGSDYTAASGTLTFTPGQTSKTLPIQVLGDATVEPDESFKVNLSGAGFATIADSQGTHTITNDDVSE